MTAPDRARARPHYVVEALIGPGECAEWCPGCHDEGICASADDCDYCRSPDDIDHLVAQVEATCGEVVDHA